jgi:hypothetical protein
MSKKPGWDWEHVGPQIVVDGYTPEVIAAELVAAAEGLRSPTVTVWCGSLHIDGWRKITDEKDLAYAKSRAEQAAAEKAKKIAKERAADLRKIKALAEKHGLGTILGEQ